MTTRRRAAALVLTVVFAASGAVPILATDAPETTAPATTAAEGEGSNALAPAVTVPVDDGAEEEVQWTYRYLIPTLIALTVLVVVATTIQYFVQVVRKRYKVVE